MSETVSGFAGGAAVTGSSFFTGAGSFAFALLIGGTPVFLADFSSAAGLLSLIDFFVFAEIRSVVLRAPLFWAAGSGLVPDFAGGSLRVLARVTMNDLSL
jgi:hypothetical protein